MRGRGLWVKYGYNLRKLKKNYLIIYGKSGILGLLALYFGECQIDEVRFKKAYKFKEERMKIRPIGERVVIKKMEAEQKTASGIVLPGAAQEQPQLAEVLEVPEAEDVKIKKGDKVIYKQYAGTEVKLDDVSYIVIDLEHILAVVE